MGVRGAAQSAAKVPQAEGNAAQEAAQVRCPVDKGDEREETNENDVEDRHAHLHATTRLRAVNSEEGAG